MPTGAMPPGNALFCVSPINSRKLVASTRHASACGSPGREHLWPPYCQQLAPLPLANQKSRKPMNLNPRARHSAPPRLRAHA